MINRSIQVVVLATGAIQCVFTGDHITKREFDRVIKVVTQEYKNKIRLFRQSRKVVDNGRPESGTESGTTATVQSGTNETSTGSSRILETAKSAVTTASKPTATAKAS